MNASDFLRSPSKSVGCCPDSLSWGFAGFPPPPPGLPPPPPGLPPPPPGLPPPPPGFPPPPPGFPPPGGPKGWFSGFGMPCPPPPPGGPDPPAVVFPAEEDKGTVGSGWTWVVEAMKALGVKMLGAKRFPGCKFVGVGMDSAIFCSSVSSSVFPVAGVRGESILSSSSSDCSSGVSDDSLTPSIGPQSDRGPCSSSTIQSPNSMGARIVNWYFPLRVL